jgi:hypothetical protein
VRKTMRIVVAHDFGPFIILRVEVLKLNHKEVRAPLPVICEPDTDTNPSRDIADVFTNSWGHTISGIIEKTSQPFRVTVPTHRTSLWTSFRRIEQPQHA